MQPSDRSQRPFGIVLLSAAAIMVVFMAMHPTSHSHDLPGLIDDLEKGAAFNGLVHGVLIFALGGVLLGLVGFAQALGSGRVTVLAGTIAFGLGWVWLSAAAIVNGFIVPSLIPADRPDPQALGEKLRPLLALCQQTNGALSRAGVVAASVALLLWGVSLIHLKRGHVGVAVTGVVCGAAPLALLASGHLPMNIHGMGGFVLAQGVWCVVVGVQMVRGRV